MKTLYHTSTTLQTVWVPDVLFIGEKEHLNVWLFFLFLDTSHKMGLAMVVVYFQENKKRRETGEENVTLKL